MADEEKKDTKTEETDKPSDKGGLLSFLPWIILGVVVIISAGAGFGLGRLMAKPASEKEQTQPDPVKTVDINPSLDYLKAEKPTNETWFFPLEPVVANINETGVMRYLRATLILEINPEIDEEKGTEFLNKKTPIMTNWLAVYLASLTIEDCRGDKNLKRIQSQILDAFNEKLFPNTKPQIKEILYKEFAIQ